MSRVAVVTGGSAGVGRATVRELAARGYDVAVLARGRAGVDAAVGEVEAAGQRSMSTDSGFAPLREGHEMNPLDRGLCVPTCRGLPGVVIS